MVRLFVDVDDTLVLYDLDAPNPYGIYYGTPYTINEPLLEGIKQFQLDNPNELIVIWSGGGKEYARMWGEDKLGLEGMIYLLKDKDSFWLVNPGDIVIDDQPLKIRTHTPHEWSNA